MGEDRLVLGYPWFVAADPKPNWAEGKFNLAIILWMAGAAKKDPLPYVKIARMRKAEVWNLLLLKKGEELYVWFAQTSISIELAIQAGEQKNQNWDKIVSKAYHKYLKVFSKEASYQFPSERPWDHAVELKPDAPDILDCKIYPLN